MVRVSVDRKMSRGQPAKLCRPPPTAVHTCTVTPGPEKGREDGPQNEAEMEPIRNLHLK